MRSRNCRGELVAGWDETSLLRAYYLSECRPTIIDRYSSKTVQRYDQALRRFEKFVGGRPRLGSITHELLLQFVSSLPSRRCSAHYAKMLGGCIRAVVRHWRGDLLPRLEMVPPPSSGTLRHWFEQHYRVEEMYDCKSSSVADTRRALVALRKFCGNEDVMIESLTSSLIANFLQHLWEGGKPPVSINNKYRAPLLAVANHALQTLGLDRAIRVKKLREIRNPPRAWTVEEMKRLLAAAQRFRPGNYYGTLRCDQFWTALIRVSYETGLRRAALFAIQQNNVDLESGWLTVDGNTQKALKGQCFKLSDDTISALASIWAPHRELLFSGVSLRTIDKHFDSLIDAAGVRYTRRGMNKFHAIRRTAATQICAQKGIAAASSFLSHSDSQVTLRYIDPTQLRHDVTNVLPSLSAG
ncbi:MAG: tyrosine-type recombinase/integrase [Pirellulales bacterium]